MLQKALTLLQSPAATRSQQLTKTIAASFVYKIINILVQFLLVRVTLSYLNESEYGFWMVLSSVFTSFNIFDFGLGNGLRNRLTQAIADGNIQLSRQLVSTTYLTLITVFGTILLIGAGLSMFVSWSAVFNVKFLTEHTVTVITLITMSAFCIRLVLNVLISVLLAMHRADEVELIALTTNFVTLLVTYAIKFNEIGGKLVITCVAYSLVPVVILLAASRIVFSKDKRVRPAIGLVQRKALSTLSTLGGQFFILQICSMIFLTAPNFVIAHLFSTSDVTTYTVIYRYLSLLIVFSNLIIVPYWSQITEASHRDDYEWIRNTTSKLIRAWVIGCFLALLLVLISGWFFDIWLGDTLSEVPWWVLVVTGVSVMVQIFNSLFSTILNALSKIRVQLFLGVLAAGMSIPLTVWLARSFNLGLISVPLALIVCMTPALVVQPLQYYKLVHNKAKGIWNK